MKTLIQMIFYLGLIALAIFVSKANAKEKAPAPSERSVPCDDAKTQKIRVNNGRLTILNFPVAPKDILPGENCFDFKQIKTDLAIKSLRPGAKTNVFVYMSERRCAFDIVTVPSGGDDIVFIRDPKDRQMEVEFK